MEAQPLTGKALRSLQCEPASITAYEGAVRSGKTIASLLDWVRFIRKGPAGPLLMTGRTERTVINNLILPLQDMLGPERVKINRGTGTVVICGREVMLIGANNEAARTKIQGLTLAGAYVDEASTLPESYFNMLYSRLSVVGARLWLTSNPEGPAHWLLIKWLARAKLWIDKDGAEHVDPDGIDLHRFSFQLEDNPTLPGEYVARIKASYVGLWYRRYIGGEWVAAEGAVFSMWDPAVHVVAHDAIPPLERMLSLGADWGTTNASAGILLGLAQGRLYAVDEWWLDGSQMHIKPTVGQQADALIAFAQASQPRPEWVVVDPAAAAFQTELFHRGITARHADNEVLRGLGLLATLLGSGHLLVSERCKALIREMPSYSWDQKATERGEDKPVKVADHAIDSFRYAVTTTEVLWRGRLAEQQLAA